MPIVLSEHVYPARIIKSGYVDGTLIPGGKTLTIETSPAGEELLSVACAAGKHWHAKITVELLEEDN